MVSKGYALRVALVRLVSMAMAVWITLSSAALAHELIPTIGDMEVRDGQLLFSLNGDFESIVAGVDQAEAARANVDEDVSSPAYDALRALGPDAFAREITAFWPEMAQTMRVLIDGQVVPLVLGDIAVPEVGVVEIVRQSTVMFAAPLPEGAQAMQIDWPAAYGVLVLRQQGVAGGWDGYLTGGLSEQVALAGGSAPRFWQTLARYIPSGVGRFIPTVSGVAPALEAVFFVLGLFMLATRPPLAFLAARASWSFRLAALLGAFTLGHTVALVVAVMTGLSLPALVLGPLLAGSLFYVGAAHVLGLPRQRFFVALFGVVHGLAFAEAFAAFMLRDAGMLAALAGYVIGLQIGQLAVITLVYILCASAIWSSERGTASTRLALGYLAVTALIGWGAFILPAGQAQQALLPLLMIGMVLALLCAASSRVRSTGRGPQRFDSFRQIAALPASSAIAVLGAIWLVQHLMG